MDKQNILFYISTIKGGGAARAMVNVANNLSEGGHKITFVTNFFANGEYRLNSNINRITLEKNESKRNVIFKNFKRLYALRTTLKSDSFDVCISFMEENNFRLLIASLWIKTKTIISVRLFPGEIFKRRYMRILSKLLYRIADGIILQTEDAKTWYPRSIQNKSTIIFNVLDKKFFSIEHHEGSGNIVTLVRLDPQKNIPLLINAFAEVVKKFPSERLDIYGTGPMEEELKAMVSSLELEDKVNLKGAIENTQDVLSKAKLFILSSDYEGLPNALMEAMAVGVPCISTDCLGGGARELIKHNVTGLLVPIRDKAALVDAIETLLNNPKYSKRLGDNAKKSAQGFHPNIIFIQWQKYIDEIITR